jgi:hypothetical protein
MAQTPQAVRLRHNTGKPSRFLGLSLHGLGSAWLKSGFGLDPALHIRAGEAKAIGVARREALHDHEV